MKRRDNALFVAIAILVVLVVWLILISLERSRATDNAIQQINEIKTQLQSKAATPALEKTTASIAEKHDGQDGADGRDGSNGKDGVDGTDGSDGRDGMNGATGQPGKSGDDAYQVALKNGFVGGVKEWLNSLKVQGDKGEPAPALDIDCINGLIMKHYDGDLLWQPTRIKCEVEQ